MSATGAFGPAPPGVDLANNQTGNMLGAVITLMVIGTASVVMRVFARIMTKDVNFAIDDYLIFAALFFSYATAVCTFISIPYGNGKHVQSLTTEEFTFVWKVLFAYVMIYATGVTCTKASIVFFYRRVFNIHKLLYFIMFFVVGYWVTVILTIFVACRPLPYFWEQYTNPDAKGTCINVPKFFLGNGIAAMLIDVVILCLPMPIVWKLQMPNSQKSAVVGILLLGSFVCIASLVRIIMLVRNTRSSDPTWTIAPVFVWSCVEPFIGILCACLPTLAPFFRRWWSKTVSGNSGRGSKNGGSYPQESGSRFDKVSKKRGRRTDYSNLGPNGDEVELTNDISGPNNYSVRTKESDEELAYPASRIVVKEDVEISYKAREY